MTGHEALTYPLPLGGRLATNEWVEWHIHRFLDGTFVTNMISQQRFDVIGTAVVLWTASFKEDPAGTLPDNDVLLAEKARYKDLDAWKAIRPLVLQGWEPVFIDNPRTGEQMTGRIAFVAADGDHGLLTQVAKGSLKRRDGKAAGRETTRLAVLKTRVKAKLHSMGKARFAENGELVLSVTKWLDQNSLFATEDNIAAGLESLHSIPRVVSIGRGGAD